VATGTRHPLPKQRVCNMPVTIFSYRFFARLKFNSDRVVNARKPAWVLGRFSKTSKR